jgi:protoporphyrinogen oxidase
VNRPTRVLVLGAGPAGLSAGYVLTKNRVETLVIEAEPYVGGLARSVSLNGFTFDLGGHRFFTKNEEILGFVREIMRDEIITVRRKSRILFRGKFVDYPLTLRSSLLSVSPIDAALIPVTYAAAKVYNRVHGRKVISFEDWGVSQFGRKMFDLFFRPYTEKIWGIPCDRLSADWASQRIRGMSLKAALAAVLLPSGRDSPKSMIKEFHYFRRGYGRVCERIGEEVRKANTIALSSRVIAVHHDGTRVQGITAETNDSKRREDGDHMISSIPLTDLVRILDPPAPDSLFRAAERLRYRDLLTVHLMFDRERVTNDHWVYVHDRSLGFARFHEPVNWSPEMAPEGKTSLVVEYFCTRGDPIWKRQDEDLIEETVRDLAEGLGLISRDELLDGFVLRHRRAYPIYDLGYNRPLREILAFLSGFENLQLVGRSGIFRYNNTDHAMETGMKAAENVLGADHDVLGVNVEKEYLETD